MTRFLRVLVDNCVAIVTVLAGIAAIVLDLFELMRQETVLRVLLALVVLLATSEIIERSRKLNRIEESIDAGHKRIEALLNFPAAIVLRSPEEAHEFITKRIRDAKFIVRHVSILEPQATMAPQFKRAYYAAIARLLTQTDVVYRRVIGSQNAAGISRHENWLQNPKVTKLTVAVAHGSLPKHVPMFTVFDDRIVVLRRAALPGAIDDFLVIRDPEIVRWYVNLEEELSASLSKLQH